ncbi:polysaccharide export protein [Pseudenhygromyxa sp. WMMC2535]|uniref:polysaccharide biosynthesis/export family protein n=1 Tax=Pseudenhygromyxa sp. WMMC2535 TaxID=2712867 RepID=UPI0015554A80|nr:polysaccharide biosynthesis/export family protein [Pseudenhygromyxa sp. WMMC2535]NVB39096.1 polysaccharide export protein [Pseudenhygromyxa sp. WMMC2535]
MPSETGTGIGAGVAMTLALALCCVAPLACFEPDHSLIPPAQPVELTSGLRSGDSFEVRVFGEPDVGGNFQVQENGTINFPLLGTVVVTGKTQAELASHLEQLLGDGFLRDPQVTVVLLERENLEISVLGEVVSPGTFAFIEELTLVQAISDAGGTTDVARVRRVRLTRKTASGPETFEVSVKAITDGREPDILLQPGDIIFVPESPI